MLIKLAFYGFLGWAIEIMWTSIGAFISNPTDFRFEGHTYLWMFFIYGFGAILLEPIHSRIKNLPWFIRGSIWMALIFVIEYLSGFLLKSVIGICPWDYSDTPYHVHGFIRLDYAPAWFCAGLLFERAHKLIDTVMCSITG